MLPCQSNCTHYWEGCHKSCPQWKLFLKKNQIEQQRKKAYLAYHFERCGSVIRQCYQMLPYVPHR